MSYEILYGRQFINLGSDAYIPVILSGSNNCTMFHGGREILERHWWCLGGDALLGVSEETLMQWILTRTEGKPEGEWFMRGGKWLLGKNMVQWMKSGIASARTVEEIRAILPSQSLHCYTHIYDNSKSYGEDGYQKIENRKFIRTTEELMEWLKEYKAAKESKREKEEYYACIEFGGIDPLGLGRKTACDKPVVCKIGTHYLSEIKENGYTYCPDKSKAIVFESSEDFASKTTGLRLPKHQLVSPACQEKNFAIKVTGYRHGGLYVQKKTRSRLYFSYNAEYAMKFVSEKEALRYIAQKLNGRFPNIEGFTVEKVEKAG